MTVEAPVRDVEVSHHSQRHPFAVGLCYLAMMCLAIGINLMPVFLTTLSHDLGGARGLSDEQLGRIGALGFSGLIVGILLMGPAADRLGAKLFAIGGNLLLAIGLVMLATAPSYPLVLLAAFALGFGAGTLDMILSPIVSALQPHRRTIAMNVLHSFYCIGAVTTILIGATALRFNVGWRTTACALMVMPLLVGAGFVPLRLPALVLHEEGRAPIGTIFRQRFFVVSIIAIFLGGATEMGMAYWLPAYAERELGYSKWTADMAFLGFSLSMAIGRLGILLLPKRIDAISIMLTCCVASVILFPLASFAPSNHVALACCILAGLAGSCLWPSTLAVAADRFPTGGATMFALLAAAGNAGGTFMPWLVGAVADHSSKRWGLVTATLCPLFMIAALLWMRAHTRRRIA